MKNKDIMVNMVIIMMNLADKGEESDDDMLNLSFLMARFFKAINLPGKYFGNLESILKAKVCIKHFP